MQRKLIAAAIALTVTGTPWAAGEVPAKPAARKAPAAAVAAPPAIPPANSEGEDLVARAVYQVLIGELALQRGDNELAVAAWNDLARRTRDPVVIARAIEVAVANRQIELALELNRLWQQVDPESAQARSNESSLLIVGNRLDDAAPQLARLLERDKANLPANLMHLNRMLAKQADKKAVQRLVDRVAASYPDLPEAHFAMGQAAANALDPQRAEAEFTQALKLRPDWEAAALARAAVLASSSAQAAVDSLKSFLADNPKARDARLTLARVFIFERRYDDARAQYDLLLKAYPDDPDVVYPLAVLAVQQGDAKTARTQLEKLLKSDFQDKSAVHFFLGQLDEDEKKLDAALAHYRLVTGGDQYVAARARAARILQGQGKHDEARELLRTTATGGPERIQLIIAEAQLLRDAGRSDEAWALLDGALARHPDNPDLLYETALAAERRGDPELMEKHLRRLLVLKPDHAHALNALGYSFADRNVRLAEAQELIARAIVLAPNDPFIMDSLGWVLFRQGKQQEALAVLEKAYGLRADPEIAAHLGEVLWTVGRRDDAARLLKEAAGKFPNNDVLATAVKKFAP